LRARLGIVSHDFQQLIEPRQRGAVWRTPFSATCQLEVDEKEPYLTGSFPSAHAGRSPIEEALAALQAIDPKWRVDIGSPAGSPDWIHGRSFTGAEEGPFHALLNRIMERLRTGDRRTVAASFCLRFGWSAWVAIVPYVVYQCVPEVALNNIALKFGANTLHERTAIYWPHGAVLDTGIRPIHPQLRSVPEPEALLRLLRRQLMEQALPVVDALHEWSGFSKKGAWGQITSSWTAQFINAYGRLGDQMQARPVVESFFVGGDEIGSMRPELHPVSVGDVTHLFQRRASCCRYYLLPQGSLCASCPLVSDQDRLKQNREWMREQLEKRAT
jgi:ferric iron reductase protein FhuF